MKIIGAPFVTLVVIVGVTVGVIVDVIVGVFVGVFVGVIISVFVDVVVGVRHRPWTFLVILSICHGRFLVFMDFI